MMFVLKGDLGERAGIEVGVFRNPFLAIYYEELSQWLVRRVLSSPWPPKEQPEPNISGLKELWLLDSVISSITIK